MSKYTFLFKENNTYDRDCVRYIELKDLKENHICCDGKFNVHGACYCMSLKDEVPYEDIITVLTKEEYNLLCNPVKGFDYTEIIHKLESEENEIIFKKVQEEEKEYLMEEYRFNEDDIEYIFNEYYLGYKDRGIVGCVYQDEYDLGYEEVAQLGIVSRGYENLAERYFDFEQFGEDLLEEEQYCQLKDGRIVYLNY